MADDEENRRMAMEDLNFIGMENAQWPPQIFAERTSEGRPCLTINKMSVFVDQVVGDQRQNRPAIKVIPADEQATHGVAQILGGWIKHVQEISCADVAIDHGFEHAVMCGYGAMRVVTEYVDDNSFDQDARIEKVDNALSVYYGPHSNYDCSDAKYCFLISDIDRDEFKEQHGEDPMPFSGGDGQYIEGWSSEKTVRVAEYFVKESNKKVIYELEDGTVVDKVPPGGVSLRRRVVEGYTIKWYLLSGNKVLEERTWVGKKYIPVIPIWGKEINVGGRRKIRGLVRNAKDPQRMYNYWVSSDTELVALAPKFPFLVTADQIAGHEAQWNESQRKNFPYLLVNPDSKAPGWPQRQSPPQASSAMVEKIQQADQEIRDTMGLQKASLGMHSNERSGVAIRERKQEGDVGTFAFVDNLARSIEHLGRVLVDMAPGILDSERIVRLMQEGKVPQFRAVNVETQDGSILNNLSVGRYDVAVVVGPSFTTQRTEARQSMSEFIQYYPAAAPVIGDLYAKSMDWPGADEVADRLTYLLPPAIKQKIDAEKAKASGETAPAQPPAQPPPDPIMMAKLEEEKLKLQMLQVKVAQEKEKLGSLQIDNAHKMIEGPKEKPEPKPEIKVQPPPAVESRQFGGEVLPFKPYMVGESGPEVMVPEQGGEIVPNDALKKSIRRLELGKTQMGLTAPRYEGGISSLHGIEYKTSSDHIFNILDELD
jgi:hypothetical protein